MEGLVERRNHRGLNGCASLVTIGQLAVQVATFQAAGFGGLFPGRRSAASALGWDLPARRAGRAGYLRHACGFNDPEPC